MLNSTNNAPLRYLSPRESDVTLGLLAGETEGDIAARLGISAHTVHGHVTRLHRKLNVQSKSDVLLRVFGTYLPHPPSRGGAITCTDDTQIAEWPVH